MSASDLAKGKARAEALREKAIEAVRKALDNAASYLDPEELRELVDQLLAEADEDYGLDGDYALDDALSDSYTSPTHEPAEDAAKTSDMQGES